MTINIRIPQLFSRPDTAVRLALTEVAGNITFTTNRLTAWYLIPDTRWPFRPDGDRAALIDAIAGQYADLAGTRLHLRRTTMPFPTHEWVAQFERHASPLPDLPFPDTGGRGAPLPRAAAAAPRTWRQHLAATCHRLDTGQFSIGRTYLGVSLLRPQNGGLFAARNKPRATLTDLTRRLKEIEQVMARAGFSARPVSTPRLAWLIHRSVGIGLTPPTPLPGDIGPDDIAEFSERIDRVRGPYASTTQLIDRSTGRSVHVAVLTVGRMELLRIPELHLPWAHLTTLLPFDVEWSSTVDILSPGAAKANVEQRLRMIRDQQREYDNHGLDAPPDLERLAKRALVIGDQMETGLKEEASRAHGWHRLAVHADTEEECLHRVRELTTLYHDRARISLQHPRGQLKLLNEFIPGEGLADTRFIRRMPLHMLAAAVPNASGAVGDNRGDLIGYTMGGAPRPVFLDLHFPMEVREGSGLSVFVSEPGGGKSTLLGALAYLAARRGVKVTLMDPSGPLAALAAMPELNPYSRVINLAGAASGTLAPYAMVVFPRRGDFPDDDAGEADFASAAANARADCKQLVLDISRMLLPATHTGDKEIVEALRLAVRAVPVRESTTLQDVVKALVDLGNEGMVAAKTAAGLLTDASELPMASAFFGSPPPGTLDADGAALTVITMAGLQLPDLGVDRHEWTTEEAFAVPMLHLAHRFAVRRCYDPQKRTERKLVGLDEGHFVAGWKSGRSFFVRLSRDSRKWNIAAILASQNPTDILGMDVQNLVSTTVVGRVKKDPVITAEALRLLGLPGGAGYEPMLAALSQQADADSHERLGYREFLLRDIDDRVQRVRVDVSHIPGLLKALNTSPGGAR